MNAFSRKFETAKQLFKRHGWRGIGKRLRLNYLERREERNYQKWVRLYDTLTKTDRDEIRRKISELKQQPLISVVMPVYNVEEKWLRRAIESVLNQLYEKWELCIADDNSPSPRIAEVLNEYAKKDARIKVVFRETNGHISAASNSALMLAGGEYTALLDHDDELSEHALYCVVKEINDYPKTDLIYSDEDKIDENGGRYAPNFKPDYSPDLLCSLNLFTHLTVYRTEILRQINGFRLGTEGSQDYDLALRFTEEISARNIRHIPRILYHWRAISGSAAMATGEKSYAHECAREVLQAHFMQKNVKAAVSKGFSEYHRVNYELPENLPKAALILITEEINKEIFASLKSILAETDYGKFELILGIRTAKSENSDDKTEDLKNDKRFKLIFFDKPENNLAACYNQIAENSDGEILVFLDGAFVPQNSDWLRELIGLAIQKNIGATGAKILNPDETIRNGGVVLGINNLFDFAHRDLPKEKAGNLARAQVINNFSAVSGVLATRREVFKNIGGFEDEIYADGLFDVDFCLRLRDQNLRTVFMPYAELIQLSVSATEKVMNAKDAPEADNFRKRWAFLIKSDPFYNPNFSLKKETFSLAMPPRVEKKW